jgi:ribonuclease BN (tRNA processing enzyme)
LVEAFSPTTVLICEANYQTKDHKKAFDKYHLTTRQAALLSKSLKTTQLIGFHFSAIYKENPITSQRELDLELSNANQLSDTELLSAIQTELRQNPKVL